MKRISCILMLFMAGHSFAADYYVATTGSDGNPGTLAQPFATMQKAVNMASAGSTVYVRGGSYHEVVSLSGKQGSSGNPITIKPYQNEIVTMDGTIAVSGSWSLHSGNIYKTTLSENVWQLWVDDKHMTVARFPNTETWSEQMWDRYAARRYEGSGSSNGTMVDNPSVGSVESLAGAGVSLNNCVAVLNTRHWTTYARLVQNHTAGSDTFNYAATPAYKATLRGSYFMEGGVGSAELVMLDRPNEWAFDETNNTLYLRTDDGLSPAGRSVRARNQDYCFVGDQNTKYVVIDGLNFFGTTFNFYRSEFITVQNCDLRYPSFSKRVLGSIDPPAPTTMGGTGGDPNQYCTVYNCEFRYVDGPVIYYKNSDFTTIENNYFYMVDYGCLDEGFALNGNNVRGPVYRRNTIEISGDSESCRLGVTNPASNPATVEYNFHTRCGLQQTDGASVQYAPYAVDGSINRYNWFIDNDRYSFRFDGNPAGQYGNFFRNVARSPLKTAYRLKGDFHEIYNNIAVYTNSDMNISVDKGGNNNSVSRNNAADLFTWWPIPGTTSHNYDAFRSGSSMHDQLRDPDNLDFRPKAGSALIDAGVAVTTAEGINVTAGFNGSAPDIGAYEYGDTSYFIGGRLWPQASQPVPPNGSTTVKLDADLMWLHGLGALSHDIYFGADSNAVASATQASPEFRGNQSNNIYDPPTFSLVPYFWRIDTVTTTGTIKGDVWTFAPIGTPADLNANGIPDPWEIAYFGSITATNGAAGFDADGDGFDNFSEYVAGTDPTNGTSFFETYTTPTNAAGFVVTLQTKLGRVYAVEVSDSMAPILWSDITNGIPGTGNDVHIYDATSNAQRYYRGRVELP